MSDNLSAGQFTPNPDKEVTIKFMTSGSPVDWWKALCGDDVTWPTYLPKDPTTGKCGLHLFLGGDSGVTLNVSSEYAPVLEELMAKFKQTTFGKAVGLIQKATDLLNGANTAMQSLAAEAKASGSPAAGKVAEAVRNAASGIKILPPNVRYETKFQKLPAWKSTSALNIGDFKFRFYMGMAGLWDGRQEVYNPALAFMKVNQPTEDKIGRLMGPMPNTAWVYGVLGGAVATGVATALSAGVANAAGTKTEEGNLQKAARGEGKYANAVGSIGDAAAQKMETTLNDVTSKLESQLNDKLNNWPGFGLITIQIGKITLPRMYVKKTSVTFSYDTDDQGYPIWADVTWSGCETVEVATTNQMQLADESEVAQSRIVNDAQYAMDEAARAKAAQAEAAAKALLK